MELDTDFSETLNDETRGEIVRSIWGKNQNGSNDCNDERIQRLSYFFEYYRRETLSALMLIPTRTGLKPIHTHAELFMFISLLKENHQKNKRELRSLPLLTTSSAVDTEAALDLAVRLMFMIACRSQAANNVVIAQIFCPRWKDTESLENFVERVFPQYVADEGISSRSITMHKLAAHYLKTYAGIQLEWTDYLTDHLTLQKGETWKSLYIFRHPGFLDTGLRVFTADEDRSTAEALTLYVNLHYILTPANPQQRLSAKKSNHGDFTYSYYSLSVGRPELPNSS
jgi:hypothetical protein